MAGAAAAYFSTSRREIDITTGYDSSLNFLTNATGHICIKIPILIPTRQRGDREKSTPLVGVAPA